MWNQQKRDVNEPAIGHMQLLRNKLMDGTLFYMGHSAVSDFLLLYVLHHAYLYLLSVLTRVLTFPISAPR
jgi:hypothetical protein